MDPGFPIGEGADLLRGGGGADLRCRHFSVETYVKMKELGPVGGGGACRRHPLGSATDFRNCTAKVSAEWDTQIRDGRSPPYYKLSGAMSLKYLESHCEHKNFL